MTKTGEEVISNIVDDDLMDLFSRATEKNGTTPEEVLTDFIKDYIVSNGHPEEVNNRWPWNKKD